MTESVFSMKEKTTQPWFPTFRLPACIKNIIRLTHKIFFG